MKKYIWTGASGVNKTLGLVATGQEVRVTTDQEEKIKMFLKELPSKEKSKKGDK